jgi:hypothetical protein
MNAESFLKLSSYYRCYDSSSLGFLRMLLINLGGKLGSLSLFLFFDSSDCYFVDRFYYDLDVLGELFFLGTDLGDFVDIFLGVFDRDLSDLVVLSLLLLALLPFLILNYSELINSINLYFD